jgi:DNA-binding HxlR family transcriptional regulator
LSQRLDELATAGVVADGPDGWALSDEGLRLFAALEPLQTWAERWARRG